MKNRFGMTSGRNIKCMSFRRWIATVPFVSRLSIINNTRTETRHIYSELLDRAEVQDRSTFTLSAGRGWLEKFKWRFNTDNHVCSGEAASADKEAVKAYVEQFHASVEEGGYTPDQVFSANEIALY